MDLMQYEITLPADYNMDIIRQRVMDRGSRTDDFLGLGIKSYLVRERGCHGSPVNQYAPIYLWADPQGPFRLRLGVRRRIRRTSAGQPFGRGTGWHSARHEPAWYQPLPPEWSETSPRNPPSLSLACSLVSETLQAAQMPGVTALRRASTRSPGSLFAWRGPPKVKTWGRGTASRSSTCRSRAEVVPGDNGYCAARGASRTSRTHRGTAPDARNKDVQVTRSMP